MNNKEEICAEFIKENYRYETDTGFIYKTKGRNCGEKVGSKDNKGYERINVEFNDKRYIFFHTALHGF